MRQWMLLGLFAAFGCAESRPDLTDQELARVESVGAEAANALKGGLLLHLGRAMQDGGITRAISFCSNEALVLTDSIAASLGESIRLKRTSSRIRNPKNQPDEHELAALSFFADHARTEGDLPQHFLQQVSSDETRYYQPLVIVAPCLLCHGSSDQIKSEVTDLLAERYPSDQATGYELGDMRGLIRVSIETEALRH